MQLGLESDVSNNNFGGAVANPDAIMHVEFYMHAPVDKWESEKEGKTVRLKEQPFVRIMRPGDKDTILEVPVHEGHKARWPEKWLYFATKHGLIEGNLADVPGWKLAEWDELKDNAELVRDLEYKRFFTVEQIAGASDAQVQRLGMVGMGLREKAKRALAEHMNAATKEAIEQRDKEIAELKAQMKEMMAMMKPKDKKAA